MAIGIQIEEELLHKEIFTILNADEPKQFIRSVSALEEMGFPLRGSFLKEISEEQSGDPGELLQLDRELLSQKRPERTKGGENLETEAQVRGIPDSRTGFVSSSNRTGKFIDCPREDIWRRR